HIVSFRCHGGIEADHTIGPQALVGDDLIQHALRIFKEPRGFRSYYRVFEDTRISACQHPRLEERRPVDVVSKGFQGEVEQHLIPQERRLYNFFFLPVDGDFVLSCIVQGDVVLVLLAAFMIRSQLSVLFLEPAMSGVACLRADELASDRYTSRRVKYVYNRHHSRRADDNTYMTITC